MLGYCALEVHTHLMYQVQNNSAVRLNPKPPRPRTVQLPGPEIHRERARSETVVKIPTNFHNIVANIGARGEGGQDGNYFRGRGWGHPTYFMPPYWKYLCKKELISTSRVNVALTFEGLLSWVTKCDWVSRFCGIFKSLKHFDHHDSPWILHDKYFSL